MLRNYLKIAFRNLWKNRLFTAINVLGLSLGLASASVLILFVQRGLTFDTFHTDNDRIYFVQSSENGETYNQTVYPLLAQLIKSYPDIETGTHVQRWNNVWMSYKGKDLQGDTRYVDTTFFDVFSFKMLYGDPSSALKKKESIVISKQLASSMFGSENPVGEIITVNDTSNFTVTGVLDDVPQNSSIQFEVLIPIANLESDPNFKNNIDWYNTFASEYVKLAKGADPQKLERQFPDLVRTHFAEGAKGRKIGLRPFSHYIFYENPAFKWMLYGATSIVVFILMIISINLLNLNMAVSLTRAKEVAVRKVTGSTLRQILIQFWTEAGLVLVCSLVLATVIAVNYLVPQFNEFRQGRMQLVLSWHQDRATVLTIAGIVGVIALLAGTYPALYLNRLDIRDTIKGKLSSTPSGRRWSRGGLILVQFVISFGLVTGAVAVQKQVSFMRKADMGFDQQNVVVVQSDLQFKDESQAMIEFRPILDDLKRDARIKSIVTSGVVPTKYWGNYNTYLQEGGEEKEVKFRHVGTGAGYASTYGIEILEGRDFSDLIDKNGENNPVVINEAAMKAMGWKTAVGKRVRQKGNSEVYYTVVGVMKNFHYQELKEKIEPLLHWYEGPAGLDSYLSLKFYDENQAKGVLAELEQKMKKIPARKPFRWFYLRDELSNQYNHMDGIVKMLNFVTVLSIVVALAGIFGLITQAANQRTKEIGIRKTLGATVLQITVLLSRDFLMLALIGNIIAIPLAYAFIKNYFQSFEYHTSVEWYVYSMVALTGLLLTLLTVGYQSIRAALTNPVESLRSE